MNWVDVAIILTLLIFIAKGWRKSFFSELLGLFGFLFAFLFSLRFYNVLANFIGMNFTLPHSFANILGFILSWYLIEILFFALTHIFFPKGFKENLFPGEKFLSIVPSFFKGLIFVTIILILLTAFPMNPQIKKDLNNSSVGSMILAKTYLVEVPLKSAFGGFTNDTLTFLTIEPKTDQSLNLGFKNNNYTSDEVTENEMIALVNGERVKAGLPPLTFGADLRTIARFHSGDMFARGYFAHLSPEGEDVAGRALKAGIDFRIIGENLAYAPSLELAHKGLMNSPGHRANILSPDFHYIGVGVAVTEEYGIMLTQVFKD